MRPITLRLSPACRDRRVTATEHVEKGPLMSAALLSDHHTADNGYPAWDVAWFWCQKHVTQVQSQTSKMTAVGNLE